MTLAVVMVMKCVVFQGKRVMVKNEFCLIRFIRSELRLFSNCIRYTYCKWPLHLSAVKYSSLLVSGLHNNWQMETYLEAILGDIDSR